MFFKYFRKKIFMKKFRNFSTNQIAGFWNFEFGAKISFKIKRVISWFQNCTQNKNRFIGSREIAFESFRKSDFCNFFIEKVDFVGNKACAHFVNRLKLKEIQNYIRINVFDSENRYHKERKICSKIEILRSWFFKFFDFFDRMTHFLIWV